jgi:two-component system, chemotaxis family, sensor kinase CheA
MKKYYYSAVAFYLVALISYISYEYKVHRTELIAHIDQQLIECAHVSDQFLPSSLHTPDMNATSLSSEQDLKNRLVLSRFARIMGVKYVYSFILEGEKVYFSSSSATPDELKSGEEISYYFDEYNETTPKLFMAFKTRKIQFEESYDQWGHFRSVYFPHVSPSGRVYITGADIEISDIDAQMHSLLLVSFGKTLFYILIVSPFFIVYRIQNKNIQKELSRQVADRTVDLQERSNAVSRLLDNANQGFLTFSVSLEVENEYSKKCLEIFERSIESETIGKLLYPDESEKSKFLEETFHAVFNESDEVKVDAILSLIPHEFVINNKAVNVVYKIIEENRCMVILTDITDKKNLEKNIERERNTLKMVVSAISNRDEFFELLEDYQNFLAQRDQFVDFKQMPSYNLSELYRAIHTYKGLFAQKDFITTPQGLHKVESKLSSWLNEGNVSNEIIQMMLNKIGFEIWLSKDIEIIENILGDDFMDKKSTISIDDDTFDRLHTKVNELINDQPDECHDLLELLEIIRMLKYKPIGEYFSSLPKYVEQISERLEKSLYPMEIEDETTFSASEEFRSFAKSLIHVIRNSVDHGIETPEERVAHDKDEFGTIHISITENEENIMIEVSDDGRGIDTEKLKQKAIESGIKTALELETDEAVMELLFEDYLSTKEEVSDLSGRGVGLASVRAEVLKMGGTYQAISEKGIGTQFIFSIPKKSINRG